MTHRIALLTLFCLSTATALAADAIPPIPRVLPPEGLEIPADVRTRLETRLAATKKRMGRGEQPDIEIFTKAVELALLHREFYVERDFAKADWALDEANKRIDSSDRTWERSTGLVVSGYRSSIDGSAQPFGLVVPKDHNFDKPCPLYVWLHGRGDKNTDLHFLQERATRPGQIAPPGAIVVHPFGRHCVGWKHAGEIDVLEVVESVKQRYKIDPDRVVLIGFSMGGAGAWHMGAHYTDQWVAVAPGAGFVDTARYQKITPDRYPEWYVQKLWGLYDVPGYVRNLFNTNVVAYSGELDPQRQAAVLMEEAYQGEGRTLTHLVGPGVEHKYEPETLKELLKRLDGIVKEGREKSPKEVHLQTRTVRYGRMHWVRVGGLEAHWQDARVDAQIVDDKQVKATTKNVSALFLGPSGHKTRSVSIDGQEIKIPESESLHPLGVGLKKSSGGWAYDPLLGRNEQRWLKGLNRWAGPIDDAFNDSFVVVIPTGKSKNSALQAWVDFEVNHFRSRWRALMRGDLPEVRDVDFDLEKPLPHRSLILWGDADSNSVIRRIAGELPVKFDGSNWKFGDQSYDGNRFVPALICPPPKKLDVAPYIVLNSGLTFREGHDRTNSQQNPKLPDWAIIDITQPPDAFTPGRIHDADFFDEEWKLKRQPKAP